MQSPPSRFPKHAQRTVRFISEYCKFFACAKTFQGPRSDTRFVIYHRRFHKESSLLAVTMSSSLVEAYEFGPFRLEPAERRLLRDGQFVPLPPKALDLLIALVSPPRAAWSQGKHSSRKSGLVRSFEEANLSYTVSLLRKALDDGNGDARYIDTVPKRGYGFKADIRTVAADISGTERNLVVARAFCRDD